MVDQQPFEKVGRTRRRLLKKLTPRSWLNRQGSCQVGIAKQVNDAFYVRGRGRQELPAEYFPTSAIACSPRAVPTHQVRQLSFDLGMFLADRGVPARLGLPAHPAVFRFILVFEACPKLSVGTPSSLRLLYYSPRPP
jgi:hypothetical protein